jgi:hypothetical protein
VSKEEPSYENKITNKFPWVTNEEFVAHYSQSLGVYLDTMFRGDGKNHMTDLSASSSTFSDAWWAIFDNLDYE